MVHVRVSSKATILTSEQQLKQLQKSLKKKHQASTGLNRASQKLVGRFYRLSHEAAHFRGFFLSREGF